MIHIRTAPDNATMKPAYCGATGQATITEAWGFYGPGGEGHDQVCKECIRKQKESRR